MTTYQLELSYQNNKMSDFEDNVEQLENIASQIKVSNSELQSNILSRIELLEQLRYLKAMNNFLDEIILYLPDNQLIYAAKSTYTPNTFGQILGDPFSDLLDQMSVDELSANGLVPMMADSTLCFIAPYPLHSIYPYGYLIFITAQEKILPFSDLPYALYWENQLLINHTDRLDISVPTHSSVVIQNDDYCLLSSAPQEGEYSLITIRNSQKTFLNFYQTRQAFIFLTIFVCSLSTLLLSIYSYFSYRPYRYLKKALLRTGLITEDTSRAKSEIFQAIQTLDILTRHNKLLDQQIVREQYTSRSFLLNRLLNNQYAKFEALDCSLQSYRVILDSAFFCVCIFKLNKKMEGNFFPDNPLYYAAYPACRIYCTSETDLRFCAIIGSGYNNNTQLQPLLRSMLALLDQQDIKAEIYAGSCISQKDQIHVSYIEALSKYNYEKEPENRIHFYKPTGSETPSIVYPQDELNGLQNALSSHNYDTALSILESLRFQITQNTFGYSMLKTICYEVFNILYREQSEILFSVAGSINSYLTCLSGITTPDDSAAFLDMLQLPFRTCSGSLIPTKDNNLNEKMEKIQNYIQKNFMRNDFYLGSVADHFDLSLNNLSQQFKRYLGISPAKYITILRIDKAKELLTKTDKSVKEIAFEIGYSDSSVFVRNFKSATAFTPIQYRENIKISS